MFDLHSYLWTIQSIDWLPPRILVIYDARTATISIATVDWTLLWNNWMWWWRIIDAVALTVLTLCWWGSDEWCSEEIKGRESEEIAFNLTLQQSRAVRGATMTMTVHDAFENFNCYLDMMDYCSGYSDMGCSMLVRVVHFVALCWLALRCIVYYGVAIDHDPLLLHSNSPTPFVHSISPVRFDEWVGIVGQPELCVPF